MNNNTKTFGQGTSEGFFVQHFIILVHVEMTDGRNVLLLDVGPEPTSDS